MSELPHIVWDMGGILYRYFTELMLDIGAERGWPLERLPLGPTGPVFDPDYQRMLDGELDEPDYLVAIQERLVEENIKFDPPRELSAVWKARTETWDTIKTIHELGNRQAVLTNDATRWLGEHWWETWDGSEWFDVIVDVTQVGVRKPAPEPYLAVAEALGVPASECLFVDDLPVNCEGAERVGMSSHLFDITDPRSSLDTLLARIKR